MFVILELDNAEIREEDTPILVPEQVVWFDISNIERR